jgi:hypothetical protein
MLPSSIIFKFHSPSVTQSTITHGSPKKKSSPSLWIRLR